MKRETVAEFLARGGKVSKIPSNFKLKLRSEAASNLFHVVHKLLNHKTVRHGGHSLKWQNQKQ